MTSKSKKSKSSGRFGARYGKRVKSKLVDIEKKQRKKQKCPYCGRKGVKRLSKGIWKCGKCSRKFASDAYFLGE
jgi:large subunit ribosomal protein L37Ae